MAENAQVNVLCSTARSGLCLQQLIFALYLFFFIAPASFSQMKVFLPLTKLEIKDGLPGINVRKITRDKFGFMWFATQDGISRFDGRSYINLNSYNVNSKRKIFGTDVYDIKPDLSGNHLWALTAYGGLNKIELTTCNVVASYQIKQSVKPDTTLWYKCMAESPANLIIGTNEGIISRFNKVSGETDYSFSLEQRFGCGGQLEDIMIDSENRVWYFISGKGILVTDMTFTKRIAFLSSSVLDKQEFFFTDYLIFKDLIFLTTTNGLKVIDTKSLQVAVPADIEASVVKYFSGKELHCISNYGSSVIITGRNILCKINFQSGEIEDIQLAGNYEDRSWITLTNSIYFNDQHIWIGSQYGVGWIRNINTPFVPYYVTLDGKNIKINHAITICAATDSIVLACGDDGLYSVNHFTSQIREIGQKDFYYSVFPVFKDYFIASGVSTGLQLFTNKLKPANILSVFPELRPIKNELMMCSAKLGDSIVFMASQNKNGLYIWNGKTKKIDVINTRSGAISLRNDDINRLFIDSKKLLWIICENAVSVYDPFKKTIDHLNLIDSTTKMPLSINMDICEMKDGFWLASYGTGVVELSDDHKIKRIYNAKDGINNLGLYKIFGLNDSMLIVSSNNGLSLINKIRGHVKNYFTEDGLQSNSFEEASGDQAGNFIFLGGINGITRADISKLTASLFVPKLSFSSIILTSQNKITDTLNIEIQKVVIPDTVTQVTIGFSAIYYSEPEQIKFSYRIIETDKHWNTTSQNFIQFFRLSPGTYHLQVQAFNEDGASSGIKELILKFSPKWYETWWFKLSIFLVVIAYIYGMYRSRINQFKKEQRIRSKLASDLHDDLGSTMNSVKVYANLAMIENPSDKYLLKVKESTQEAINGIRDIIWVLDDKRDSIEHLLARVSVFAAPLCDANNMRYKQDIADDARDFKLGQEEKRNLYMILKEAVNNAIKYSSGKKIEINIEMKKSRPGIKIEDDGQGFAIETANEGNGLKNMTRRAKEIKYSVQIQSAPGAGTVIQLQKI
jgi:hypothetical protein